MLLHMNIQLWRFNVNVTILFILRIVHIFAGVLWVGSAVSYFFFVEPSVKGLGMSGPKFMQEFIERRQYPLYMNIVSALTIVAGALLYWNTSGGLQLVWLKTGAGLGFTIGALVALVVYLIGFFMIRPRAGQLGALGKQIGMSGGTPNAEQVTSLQQLDHEMRSIERIDVILLTISLLAMATARYW
jgi:uncharacterized membrane protein